MMRTNYNKKAFALIGVGIIGFIVYYIFDLGPGEIIGFAFHVLSTALCFWGAFLLSSTKAESDDVNAAD